jgi:hypothetical protein
MYINNAYFIFQLQDKLTKRIRRQIKGAMIECLVKIKGDDCGSCMLYDYEDIYIRYDLYIHEDCTGTPPPPPKPS